MIKENDILGFDPTLLEVFNNQEMVEEIDEYNQIEKEREDNHINNCIKHKRIWIYGDKLHVYLAGKINKNDWRKPIVGYRCGNLMAGDQFADYTIMYNFRTIITGPWYLSCDHGCYHGDNTHGVGINKLGCPDAFDDIYDENQVFNICLKQINRSDIVFAYIYDNTCYGTIYELAYARTLGKRIVIIFSDEKLMSNMWFICQGADIVDLLEPDKSIKTKFDEIISTIKIY